MELDKFVGSVISILITTSAFAQVAVGSKMSPPVACDPGEKQIILVNKSSTITWAPGTKVGWKTDLGETGKFKIAATSSVPPGATLPVPIMNHNPAKCKAKIKLP